jgi:hypothetical protein
MYINSLKPALPHPAIERSDVWCRIVCTNPLEEQADEFYFRMSVAAQAMPARME